MKICFLLTYANPHVTGWIDEFIRITDDQVIVGVISSVKKYRKNYFTAVDNKEGYLFFFKKKKYRRQFYSHLKDCDCFITLGIFEPTFLYSLLFLPKQCKVFVLSEPFNPYSHRKVLLRRLYSTGIKILKSSEKFMFLCVGGEAVKKYYMSIGFRKSSFFEFGHFPALDLTMKEFNPSSPLNFIYVGQLIERKGVDLLICLIQNLKRKYSKWNLLIIGDGILKNQVLSYCKAEQRIRYIENVDDLATIKSYFTNHHVLFLPSYFDGWGAVVNEAISSCCSLFLSDEVYAGKALLRNSENGFSFSPYNKEDMLCALDKYFEKPEIIFTHMENSKKIFAEWNHKNAAYSLNNFLNNVANPQNKTLLERI